MPFMPQITNIPQAQNTQGAVFRAPQRPQVSMDMIKAASGSPLAEAASKAMSELGGFISDRAFQNDLSKADGLESLMTLQPTSAKQFAMLQQKEGQFKALQKQAMEKQTQQLLQDKFDYTKEHDAKALENAIGIEKAKQAFELKKTLLDKDNAFKLERFKQQGQLALEGIKSSQKLTPVKQAIQKRAGETLANEIVKTEKDIGKEFEDYQEDKNIFWDVGLGKEETETLSNWNKAFLSRIDIPDESKIAFSAMNPMQKAKILAAVNNQTVEEADVIDFLKPKWMGGSDYRFKQIKP